MSHSLLLTTTTEVVSQTWRGQMKSSVSWFQHRQLILSGSLGGNGERRVDLSIVRAVSTAARPRISIFPRGVEVKRKSSVRWFQHCHLILPWKSGWQGEKGGMVFSTVRAVLELLPAPEWPRSNGGLLTLGGHRPHRLLPRSFSSPSLTSVGEPFYSPGGVVRVLLPGHSQPAAACGSCGYCGGWPLIFAPGLPHHR